MQINAAGILSIPCSQALAPYLRVKYDATYGLELAGPEDRELGTVNQRHLVTGLGTSTHAAILAANMPGTIKMVASGAITAFTGFVYGGDDGKVSGTANGNPIGIPLSTTTADGDTIEVMRLQGLDAAGGDAVGGIELFDDFIGDALTTKFTYTATNGLGVVASDAVNGIAVMAFDSTSEAATAAIYNAYSPFTITSNPVFETRLAIFDIGADATVDINFGLANDTHATDFDSVTRYAAFHLDGASLVLKAQSTDGTTTVAATSTGVTLVDNTYNTFKIDASDLTDVKFYVNGTRVLATTTFDVSAWTGGCTPIIHVEKTTGTTLADVRVDWLRCQGGRA